MAAEIRQPAGDDHVTTAERAQQSPGSEDRHG
jgi:hypothetical protein